MTTTNVQINVYSRPNANIVAERLKEYNPLIEDWTKQDDGS